MKTNISVYFSILLLLSVLCSDSFATTGGGSGFVQKKTITPYEDDTEQNVDNINNIRKESHSRRVANVPLLGECKYISLIYISNFSGEVKTEHSIRGYNLDTGIFEKIYFGDIEELNVLESDYYSLLIKIKVFPNISTHNLKKQNPTYKDLVSDYSLFKKLRIDTHKYSDSSLPLQIKCTKNSDSLNTFFLHELNPDTIIKFSFDLEAEENPPIWWAIDSVIDDDTYPYYKEDSIGPIMGIK